MDNKKNKNLMNKKKFRPTEEIEEQKEETNFYKDEDIQEINIKEEENEELKQINKINKNIDNINWINKTRTLIVSSRGITHQERHLMNDLLSLIPNAKKEFKIEKNTAREELVEICYNHSCKYCLYFEHRKREFILWLFKSPEGPLIKFKINNIHVLNEIKLMGNCIKYSRPLLSFDKSFQKEPYLQLIKEMLIQTFNSPKGHPKTRPFYDHIISFCCINDNIFFRNFQILNDIKEKFKNEDSEDKLNLLEIGPRFTLEIIRIFNNALGGKTLYLNKNYISPRRMIKNKIDNYKKRKLKEEEKNRQLNQ
jgi:ribosome biogenesis protein BRX1